MSSPTGLRMALVAVLIVASGCVAAPASGGGTVDSSHASTATVEIVQVSDRNVSRVRVDVSVADGERVVASTSMDDPETLGEAPRAGIAYQDDSWILYPRSGLNVTVFAVNLSAQSSAVLADGYVSGTDGDYRFVNTTGGATA